MSEKKKNVPDGLEDLGKLVFEYEKSLESIFSVKPGEVSKEKSDDPKNVKNVKDVSLAGEVKKKQKDNVYIKDLEKLGEPKETYSPVHEKMVEQIIEKNNLLSKSIWTDKPVLKPEKSNWLNNKADNITSKNKNYQKNIGDKKELGDVKPEPIADIPPAPRREVTIDVSKIPPLPPKREAFEIDIRKVPASRKEISFTFNKEKYQKPEKINQQDIKKNDNADTDKDKIPEKPEVKNNDNLNDNKITKTDKPKEISEKDIFNKRKNIKYIKNEKPVEPKNTPENKTVKVHPQKTHKKRKRKKKIPFWKKIIAVWNILLWIVFISVVGSFMTLGNYKNVFGNVKISANNFFTKKFPYGEKIEKIDSDFMTLLCGSTNTDFNGKKNFDDNINKNNVSNSDKSESKTENSSVVESSNGNAIVFNSNNEVRAIKGFFGYSAQISAYADEIDNWKSYLGDSVNIYNMAVPTSAAFYYPEKFKDNLSNQKDLIDRLGSELDNAVHVDVYNQLASHPEEYIYSRTDSHWQPLGAYYAAGVFAERSGVGFNDIGAYEKCEKKDFVGDMYFYSGNNKQLKDNPDTFTYYKPSNDYTVTYYDSKFLNPDTSKGLFYENAKDKDCYFTIMGGDSKITKIKTDYENERVLVIFKDSFANALVPFLTNSFSEIYVCDINSFDIAPADFCKNVGCTDVLFCMSLESCCNAKTVQNITDLRQKS